ncbi:MAG: NfeD family protein, partial [Syntrophorhabdus sp.]
MFNTFEFIGTSFLRPDIIWFLAGLIMLLIEFIAPGIFFLFFAIGAWVVVILTLVFDMPLSMQLLSFLVFSIASLVVLRKRFKKIFTGNQSHNVTIDDEFIGARARTVSKISS